MLVRISDLPDSDEKALLTARMPVTLSNVQTWSSAKVKSPWAKSKIQTLSSVSEALWFDLPDCVSEVYRGRFFFCSVLKEKDGLRIRAKQLVFD